MQRDGQTCPAAFLEAQEHRRQIKTHTPFDPVPFWPQVRCFTVYRHLFDIHFSYRKHLANMARGVGQAPLFENRSDSFQEFLAEDVDHRGLGRILDYYRCTLAHEPRENLIRLNYTDMLRDLPGAVALVAATLASGPSWRFDLANSLLVDISSGSLQSVTDEQLFAGANALALETAPGTWEVLQFGVATIVSTGRWKLIRMCLPEEPLLGALGTNPYWARNWILFGQAVQPVPGAVLIFERGTGGHVGFAVGQDDTHFFVLGGNQSDAVTIGRVAKSRLLGARWPATYPPRLQRLPTLKAGEFLDTTNEI